MKKIVLMAASAAIVLMVVVAVISVWAISPRQSSGVSSNLMDLPARYRTILGSLKPTGRTAWTLWRVPTVKEERLIISGEVAQSDLQAFVERFDFQMVGSHGSALPGARDAEEAGHNSEIRLNFGPSTECYFGKIEQFTVRPLFFDPATRQFLMEIKTRTP